MSTSTLTHTHERRTADELRVLARVASVDLDGAKAQDIVRWAAEAFGSRVLVSQSMANTAVAHLVHSVAPEIPAVFLDTGYHFDGDAEHARRAGAHGSGCRSSASRPCSPWRSRTSSTDPSCGAAIPTCAAACARSSPWRRCCSATTRGSPGCAPRRRRTAPGRRSSRSTSAAASSRSHPILHWTDDDLLRYTLENDVVVNPLIYQGYPSIGCATCTHPVQEGDDPRAGRWRGTAKNECGLHA